MLTLSYYYKSVHTFKIAKKVFIYTILKKLEENDKNYVNFYATIEQKIARSFYKLDS